jgi:hypothetical protein
MTPEELEQQERNNSFINNIFTKPNTKTGAKALAGLAGIAYAASANQAEGASFGWSADGRTGLGVNNNGSDGYVTLSLNMKNNSNNFTIENGEVFAYNILNSIYNMTQEKGTYMGSKEDFLNSINSRINHTDSEVQVGWNENKSSDGGTISLDKSILGGENWYSTDQDSNNDTMIYDFLIPTSVVDWDHNGYVQGSGDGLSLVQQASSYDTWKGVRGEDSVTAQGNWIAIPEPGTMILFGLAGLTYAGRKFCQKKLHRE